VGALRFTEFVMSFLKDVEYKKKAKYLFFFSLMTRQGGPATRLVVGRAVAWKEAKIIRLNIIC